MAQLRTLAVPVGVLAAVLLFLLVNPWIVLEGTISQIVTIAFWASFILLLIILFSLRDEPDAENIEVEGLPSRGSCSATRVPGSSGCRSASSSASPGSRPDGTSSPTPRGSATRRHSHPRLLAERGGDPRRRRGRPAITYEWYRAFIQFLIDNGAESWMTYVITFGEMAVGIGLILGLLTGFAAFFGALMNMSFLLAGSASSNPVMFTLAVGLMLAWKVAGYYGLDRYLLPLLGTPWRHRSASPEQPQPGPASG